LENISRKTILIVDDEEPITDAYRCMLKQEFSGFDIFCFNEFDEAEKFIKKNLAKIAIALFDWRLDNNRLSRDLALQIRNTDVEKRVAILLLTGTPIDLFPEKTLALYDSVIIKPVERPVLIARIKEILKI